MATLHRRGPQQWEVSIRRKGYPTQRKTHRTKAEAEAWAAVIESEMARGVFISRSEAERTTIAELIARYRTEALPKLKGRGTAPALKHVERRLGVYSLAALQSKHVSQYRDDRLKEMAGASTIRKELNTLSVIIDLANGEWSIPVAVNPCKSVKRPSEPSGRERRLIADEEARIIAACRQTVGNGMESIFRLALETACRQGELIALRWENIDLTRSTARIPETKTGKPRTVPLSPAAIVALEMMEPSTNGRVFDQWSRTDSFRNAWKRTIERARESYEQDCRDAQQTPGVLFENLTFHDLRHEATSRLADKVPNVIELAAITGHNDLQSLKRYYHTSPEKLAQKLAQ